MRIGCRIVLAGLIVLASFAAGAVDCKAWLPLFPKELDGMISNGPAALGPAGDSRPDLACRSWQKYVDLDGARLATLTILQGSDARLWGLYEIESLMVAGKAPNVTWETIAGQKVVLHLWTEDEAQPPRNTLSFSPKEGFLLMLDVESQKGKPPVSKAEMLRIGALLPLPKFAEMSAKMN